MGIGKFTGGSAETVKKIVSRLELYKMDRNARIALDMALESFVRSAFALFVATIICAVVLPADIRTVAFRLLWIVIIYSVFVSIKIYKRTKSSLTELAQIEELKLYDDYPLAALKSYSLNSDCWAKIYDKKLDRLKAFTPIPFIIFMLGMFSNNNVMLEKSIILFSIDIRTSEFLVLLAFGVTIIYIFVYNSLVNKYQQQILIYSRYQKEIFEYEERLQSLEKKNERFRSTES